MCRKTYRNSDGRQRGISKCGDGIDGAAVRGVPAEKKLTGAGKSPVQGAEIGKICNEENGRIKLFNHDLVKRIFGTATQKQGEKEKEDMHEMMHKRRILLFRVNSFKNRLQV